MPDLLLTLLVVLGCIALLLFIIRGR